MNTNLDSVPCSAAELIKKLQQSDSIPALDENVRQLCRLTGSRSTAAADLTAVIMRDAALTSRLLSMANSASYRSRVAVKTISAAVILFGFDRIQQLAVGLSIFHKHAGDIRDKELYRLLVCAYCTGNLAMHMGRLMHDENPEELFVEGLLRQIPRLSLANGFPDLYHKMEQLTASGQCSIDVACKQVFNIELDDIKKAIAEHWKLLPAGHNPAGHSALYIENRKKTILLATEISDLIFGNSQTGPEAVQAVSEEMSRLLKTKLFSLPEFVGASAQKDPNMQMFFNLTEQDLSMMTRIAEWGKVSSAEVANRLTESFVHHSEAPLVRENEPLMMAHFLSELMLSVCRHCSFNDVLMMAQEGIYRCMQPECVIAAFIDPGHNQLQGRLCASRLPGINASHYRVSLNSATLLAALNMKEKNADVIKLNGQAVLDDDHILKEMNITTALIAPIAAGGSPIGQFFLGRGADSPPFSPDDCLWVEAIAGHVALSFEQIEK